MVAEGCANGHDVNSDGHGCSCKPCRARRLRDAANLALICYLLDFRPGTAGPLARQAFYDVQKRRWRWHEAARACATLEVSEKARMRARRVLARAGADVGEVTIRSLGPMPEAYWKAWGVRRPYKFLVLRHPLPLGLIS